MSRKIDFFKKLKTSLFPPDEAKVSSDADQKAKI